MRLINISLEYFNTFHSCSLLIQFGKAENTGSYENNGALASISFLSVLEKKKWLCM
jgi:hypothetical protein